ncbi:MAG: isopeptide-forming domain-containing fimbrial protein [Oscillospiraceae bacterium]|nr:isopeptide-forming domain-containing fimbrial protein [Oscillospiraceae bacterium]
MKRKILSFLLAAMMVLPFAAVNVFAAESGESITIHGPSNLNIVGETFTIYKIFDLESWDKLGDSIDDERFAYRINPEFEDFDAAAFVSSYFGTAPADLAGTELKDVLEYFRRNSDPSSAYSAIGSEEVLEQNDDSWAVPLTGMLLDYIKAKGISPDVTAVANADPFVISGLDLGYYLICSEHYNPTNGDLDDEYKKVTAIAALKTNEIPVSLYCKADGPTIDKDVWHEKADSSEAGSAAHGWGGFTDVNIGDTVYFKLTSKVPNMRGYSKYYMAMYDLLSDGLKFNDDIEVYLADPALGLTEANVPAAAIAAGAQNVSPAFAGFEAGSGYNIKIDLGDVKGWYPDYVGWDIIVIYSAELNENAVISTAVGDEGNPNKVWLEYSNNPYDVEKSKGKTREKRVTVFTFEINAKKTFVISNGNETEPKEGAVFNLYKAEGFAGQYDNSTNKFEVASGTAVTFVDLGLGKYMRSATAGATADIQTPTGGLVDLIGLEAGEYFLVETSAPKGFNLLEDPIKITITYTADGSKMTPWAIDSLSQTYENDYDYVYGEIKGSYDTKNPIEIENKSGIKFPETGGIGTLIFYVTGGLLTIGAGFLLAVRHQLSKKKERAEKSKQIGRATV